MIDAAISVMVVLTTLGLQSPPDKPAWAWTVEERVARRTHPEARQARRIRDLPSVRQVAEGWSPINGQHEPELFLPSELLLQLMRAADPQNPQSNVARELYRENIAKSGWDYEDFWDEMETTGSVYFQVGRNAAEAQRISRGRVDLTPFHAQICAARTAVFARARGKFGAEAFNKFLYTAVAPHLRSWHDDKQDIADVLTQRERPCN